MITKGNDIEVVSIFIRSTTYTTWQRYCRMRDRVSPYLGITIESSPNRLSDATIKKYILPSTTFRLWKKMYDTRQHIVSYIPQAYKQKIKTFLSKSHIVEAEVSPRIKREWAAWSKNRADGCIDMLNFGVISYDYRFQRPQQLAVSLAKTGNRVFYIETEFIHRLSPKKVSIKVRKATQNVYVVTLSAPKHYFIYQDTPNKKGAEILFASLKTLLRQARIVNPIAKIDHPFWGILREKLSIPIVYDVMDLHDGFKESGKNIRAKHNELAGRADLVLSSSTYLERSLKKVNKNTLMLRNAGEYDHFAKAAKPTGFAPAELRSLPRPIIGYYGALAEWLDTDLVEATAKALPNASLVFIGRPQNKILSLLAKKYANIHLLGEKRYSSLPKYLSHFDVCLIPFKLTKLIKATNPVKIYEYFAAGKPVVASPIPELNMYKHLLYRGATPQSFVAGVQKALREQSAKLKKKRQQIALANTWTLRAKTLDQELRKQFFPKVSIVILVYNHVDLSQISIDSVLERSKYPNLELLAVDNQSDKETQKMLRSYIGKPNIKVIFNPENYGFAKGNNVGMKRATGEYIVLLNNDVRVTPGWIERLLYHARGKNIGLVGPVTNSIGNESKIDVSYNWDNAKEIESKSADYVYAHWGETLTLRNIAAFAWLSPRSVYTKIGGLDERFGRGLFEDDDYCVRVGRAKLDILCAEDAFVHHYGGASTNWGSPEFQLLFNTNKAKFESKWKTKWIPHQYRKK